MMGETYDTLKFERDGAGAVITLHRPQAGNAIDVDMARDLMHAAISPDFLALATRCPTLFPKRPPICMSPESWRRSFHLGPAA
jgi:hypothetical protein